MPIRVKKAHRSSADAERMQNGQQQRTARSQSSRGLVDDEESFRRSTDDELRAFQLNAATAAREEVDRSRQSAGGEALRVVNSFRGHLDGDERPPGIILPAVDEWKGWWDGFVMICILYSSFLVPFRLAFGTEADGVVWALEVGISLCFIADIFITFNTAVPDRESDSRWITSRETIARRYVCGWFVIDFPSAIPCELIELAFQSEDFDSMQTVRVIRVLRLARIVRMLKLLKLNVFLNQLEEDFDINLSLLRIVTLFFKVLFLAHLVGCGWMAVGLWSHVSGEESWLDLAHHGKAADAHTALRYLLAFHWSLGVLTGGAPDDIPIVSNLELVYATFGSLIGLFMFGYAIGEFSALLAVLDKQRALVEERMDSVKDYLRWRQLPRNVALAVRRYYAHYYEHRAVFDEQAILGGLNPELHATVVDLILKQSMGHLPIFRKMSPTFQIALFPFLKPMKHKVGEIIYRRGAESHNMKFLIDGEVAVLSATDDKTVTNLLRAHPPIFEHARVDDDGNVLDVAQWEGCFGQSVLTGNRRATYCIASTPCQVLMIEKADLLHLFAADPRSAARLCNKALRAFVRDSRIREVVARWRITSLPRGPEHSALIIARCWRKKCFRESKKHDSLYRAIQEQLEVGKRPQHLDQSQRLLEPTGVRNSAMQPSGGGDARTTGAMLVVADSPEQRAQAPLQEASELVALVAEMRREMREMESRLSKKMDTLIKAGVDEKVSATWGASPGPSRMWGSK